jgi:hypothetical protein
MGIHDALVHDLLESLDPGMSITRIGQIVADSISTNPAIATMVKEIHSRIPDPLIQGDALQLFQRLRGIGPRLVLPDAGEVETVLVPVLYASAQANLEPGDVALFQEANLKKNLKKASRKAAKVLNSQFLGELLVETQIQSAKNPAIARKLTEAASAIRAATPEFESQLQRADVALARKCTLGGKPCGVVCWIIVIIIIIIVILLPAKDTSTPAEA